MPVSLIPKSRRHFLQTGALASLGALTVSAESNDNWYALLADTHIDANPEKDARGTNMAANLKQVVAEILAEKTAPDFVVVNGDCAFNTGLEEDYTTFRALIQPLLDAEIPIHLTMGNHDDRGPFYTLFPESVERPKPAGKKHLAILETPHVNWLLLDTLDIVNKVTGRLGEEQLAWLSKTLDQLDGKPVLVMGHHNLQYPKKDSTATITGLADTVEFMEVLSSKPQVKAYFYGHTHSYGLSKSRSGFHLINQPPVAYLFNETRPNGWIKVSTTGENLSLTLNCLKKDHELHGKNTVLSLT